MILLVDIGNSRIKWACLEADKLLPSSCYDYKVREMSWDWLGTVTHVPESIYVINVGSDEVEIRLAEACREYWGITPVRLHTESYIAGLRNGYDNPLILGVDRWAAMLGAYQLVKDAVLVIDCGTACSADVVDVHGRHLGGALIPGLALMQQSLSAGTVRIGTPSNERISPVLGTTTTGCIQFGATEAILGFIERMERHASTLTGARGTVFLTGGGAPALLPRLQNHVRYEKELVFLGMVGLVREKGSNLLL